MEPNYPSDNSSGTRIEVGIGSEVMKKVEVKYGPSSGGMRWLWSGSSSEKGPRSLRNLRNLKISKVLEGSDDYKTPELTG